MSFLIHFDRVYYPHLGRRRDSFRKVFEALETRARSFYTIVEMGVAHMEPNCGAREQFAVHGHSTILFDRFVNYYDGEVYSVDLSKKNCERARGFVSLRTLINCSDSVAFARQFPGDHQIDCLYLDSLPFRWEDSHSAALHHLRELWLLLPHMSAGGVILVDDNDSERGRGMYIRNAMEALGAIAIFAGYQMAWQLVERPDNCTAWPAPGLPVPFPGDRNNATVRYRWVAEDIPESLVQLLPGGRVFLGTAQCGSWQIVEEIPEAAKLEILQKGAALATVERDEAGQWTGTAGGKSLRLIATGWPSYKDEDAAASIARQRFFEYVRVGSDRRFLELLPGGVVGRGGGACEQVWFFSSGQNDEITLNLAGNGLLTCQLASMPDGSWQGKWLVHERMPVQLKKWPFPLELSPQFQSLARSQVGQDRWLYQNVFGEKRNGIFVDVGAWGENGSNTWFFEKALGWRGLLIEPNPPQCEILRQTRASECIQVAIAVHRGTATFRQLFEGSMLSGLVEKFDPRSRPLIEQHTRESGGIDIEVPCVPLQDLLDRHGITHIDYLSIDTEGGYEEVLSTVDYEKVTIGAITVEDNFGDTPTRAFLESKGFVLVHQHWPDLFFLSRSLLATRPHLPECQPFCSPNLQ